MKEHRKQTEMIHESGVSGTTLPAELYRKMKGQSRRVKGAGMSAPDSMLAVHNERVTYTFIMNDEVASIHFDGGRGEIFFKGHNLKNIEMNDSQMAALMQMKEVMASDERAESLLSDYCATLDRLIADNK